MYKNDPYDFDQIPDYALQPAKPEEDDSAMHGLQQETDEGFDASVYDKLFSQLPPLDSKTEAALRAEVEKQLKEQTEAAVSAELEEPEAPEEQEASAESEAPKEPEASAESEASEEAKAEPALVFLPPAPTAPSAAPPSSEVSLITPMMQGNAPVKGAAPIKLLPIGSAALASELKLTDIKKKPQFRIFIEEDILVPDVKPDLAAILSMEGKLKLSDTEISVGALGLTTLKVTGDLMLQTLYIPERPEENEPIISIDSRIFVKEEADMKAEAGSDLLVNADLESIDFTVVNERKFRVRAVALISVKEYGTLDVQLFEGVQGEEVQLLKERIHLTDVVMRKTETMELEEDFVLKDTLPEIGKILCVDVNVVENHKQISREKAVINAAVFCNVMYLCAEGGSSNSGTRDISEPLFQKAEPVLYQGKTEFTQFMRLGGEDGSPQNPAGSQVRFHVSNVAVSPKADETGRLTVFSLKLSVDTGVELYKDTEKEIVCDVYHHIKEMRYDTDDVSLMNLCGTGVSEVSAREIINIPEKYTNVDRVAFISGSVREVKSSIDAGKSIVEGTVDLKLICIAGDEKKTPFHIRQALPFRCAIDIPGIKSDMDADTFACLKELWFDKLNNRQIEVNAGLFVSTGVMSRQTRKLIKNVSFAELGADQLKRPGIVVYITRKGDDLWKIAKKYRTTIDALKKINNLDYAGEMKPGTKLLIVK